MAQHNLLGKSGEEYAADAFCAACCGGLQRVDDCLALFVGCLF